MTKEQLTQEWIDNLSDCKRKIVKRLNLKNDFLVLGDAMPFIEEVASAFEYNNVYVKLQTLDDLRGTPVLKHHDKTGLDYFVGLICTDKTRDLERTTTFELVNPVILWE